MSAHQHKTNNNLEGAKTMNQKLVIQTEIPPIGKHEINENRVYNQHHLSQVLWADYEYINPDDAEAKSEEIIHRTAQSLHAFKPRNEIESMLAAQMLVTHNATMECYARLQERYNGETTLIDSDLNNASKLSRTFVTLLEALQRSRQG